jgi:exosortase
VTLSRRHALFFGWCLAVGLVAAPFLRQLVAFAWVDETASYVLLVPLVTVVLLVVERRTVFTTCGNGWPAAAVLLVVAGVLGAAALSSPPPSDQLTFGTAAVVVSWIAGFVGCYGLSAARAAAFPLLFLLFTIPVPASILNSAITFLQHWSAEATDVLFTLTGTTFHREGYVFTMPDLVIKVAEECSGIRSSAGLLLTTLLAGHIALRSGWTKTLLALAVIPVTILKNAIRIVSLSLLSIHVDPGFMEGWLHRSGGIVFLVIAMGLLLPVLTLLSHLERETGVSGAA